MKGSNLKFFALGALLVAIGLSALAVTIPNTFSAGQVVSAAQLNANFQELKAAVDSLQASKNLTGSAGYYAYAWVNVISGTPDTSYSHNPAGSISVASATVGKFTVAFNGTHPPIRTVQVTAYEAGSDALGNCRIVNWGSSSVNVNCYNNAGTPADTRFVISVAN